MQDFIGMAIFFQDNGDILPESPGAVKLTFVRGISKISRYSEDIHDS